MFLREDGLLVGYLVTDDVEAAQAALAVTEVNARWQAEMAEYFVDGRPDHHMRVLAECSTWTINWERHDDQRAGHGGAAGAADRDGVVGVWQFGYAV
jgi:hypothetical protein